MSLASILQGAEMQQQLKDVVLFLSNPTIALAIGLLFATFLLKRGSGFEEMVENSLKRSGPILFITAAGSVLGNIVAGIVAPFAEAMGLASPIDTRHKPLPH